MFTLLTFRFTLLQKFTVAISLSQPILLVVVVIYIYQCYRTQRYFLRLLSHAERLNSTLEGPKR